MSKTLTLFFGLLFTTGFITAQLQYFESFDKVKIAYTVEGEGSPVLLLHGFINSRKSWDKTVLKGDLLAKGYQVIIPDLRGNGNSDKPQNDEAYQENAEVKDLLLLMDSLGIERYKAIGYSRGSIVLAKLMTKDKRIAKAVLGGMGIDFTNAEWDRRLIFAAAFNGQTTSETQGAVDYAKSVGADLRSLHLQQKYQPVTSKEALAKVQAKVLVIAGDKDLDNGNPIELQRIIPDAKLELVAGDHNGTYKTNGFAKAILKFMK
ncbi:alpha/beta fold hydrolase [uncultured Croceitalea sp.]|uniref:alpha/beta fold hydrolase n=1 Tax=uncultured Croceitalea sp. TaxID=1798908 RepID=UPI0033061B71